MCLWKFSFLIVCNENQGGRNDDIHCVPVPGTLVYDCGVRFVFLLIPMLSFIQCISIKSFISLSPFPQLSQSPISLPISISLAISIFLTIFFISLRISGFPESQETKIIQKRGRAANNLLHFLITLLYLAETEIWLIKDDIKMNLPMSIDPSFLISVWAPHLYPPPPINQANKQQ